MEPGSGLLARNLLLQLRWLLHQTLCLQAPADIVDSNLLQRTDTLSKPNSQKPRPASRPFKTISFSSSGHGDVGASASPTLHTLKILAFIVGMPQQCLPSSVGRQSNYPSMKCCINLHRFPSQIRLQHPWQSQVMDPMPLCNVDHLAQFSP